MLRPEKTIANTCQDTLMTKYWY